MPEISPGTVDFLINLGINALAAVAILVAGWLIAAWTQKTVRERAARSPVVDATLAIVLGKIARILVVIVTVIAVLNQFGVQTASLIALLGTAGLAIGLALQGALSNVAAGILLLVLRPFRVGDFVEFASTAGSVDEIGLFVTRMHTPDNVGLIVPNSQIWGSAIKNFAQNNTRRIDLTFGIGYGDDMDKAVRLVTELIAADERFLKDPEPFVAVAELADSSVNIFVRPWAKREDQFAARLDLIKNVKERFDAENISIPFPQRQVHMVQMQTKAA
jgi:small conductance mechanosensitive channel